ncbi:hypothetical protein M9Y10_011867 [Tritrichomonas musculus]|uniref:PHD-type domain-containing protein n=1 Tax=Tritrichomonas musculus TaxID=1915356 RepID=A0ABR2ICN4_9EUKA
MSDFYNYNTAEEAPPLVSPTPYPLDENDDDDEKFEIACVCNKQTPNCSLVQCEKCNYWFHKGCIYIPREPTGEYSNFYCPYCLQQKIRCKCGDSSKYNEEMIMCSKCHFYVHKKCELTDPKIKDFICSHCASKESNANDDGMLL